MIREPTTTLGAASDRVHGAARSGARSPRVVFFIPEFDAANSAVLESQVLTLIRYLSGQGLRCAFAGVCAPGRTPVAQAALERFGVNGLVMPEYPAVPTAVGLLRAGMRLVSAVRQHGPRDIDLVYVWSITGLLATRLLTRDLGALTIFDLRGLIGAEAALRRGAGWRSAALTAVETWAMRHADRVACASTALKEYVSRCAGRSDAIVVPCCVDEETFGYSAQRRERVRAELGVDDDGWLLVYSGGTSAWQRIDDVVAIMAGVVARVPRAKALVLTPDPVTVERLLQRGGIRGVAVRSARRHEVSHYLSAADLGLLIRDQSLVNLVASPVKVSEYLACGTPIALTGRIGDVSGIIDTSGAGLVVRDVADAIERIDVFLSTIDREEMPKRCIDTFHRHFRWDAHRDELARLYSAPGSSPTWRGS